MRKTLITLAVVMSTVLVAGAASAQADFTGSLIWTEDDSCLDANLNWADTGTRIDWEVSQAALNGPWTYSYTLTVADDPQISHWILELTPGTELTDFITTDYPLNAADFKTYSPSDPGNDNPGLPCDIYGVKFDSVNALSKKFTFTTDIAPVWGDFYAKGGATTRVFNESFCEADPTNPPADGSIDCKLLRPDSAPVVIPEPSSMIMAMMGALPMIGYRLRKRH